MKTADDKRYWNNHFRKLGSKDSGIVGKRITVRRISGEDIGYTSGEKPVTIYINPTHEIAPKDIAAATKFADGINCHEIYIPQSTNFFLLLHNIVLIVFDKFVKKFLKLLTFASSCVIIMLFNN